MYKRIVLIGSESTGKTTICQQLATEFATTWIPEYARTYIENLSRPYTYDDVVHIAEKQVSIERDYLKMINKWLFFDTDLIITKIWMLVLFEKMPTWIDTEIRKNAPDLYLLCSPDLPWVFDPVRENAGEMRLRLHNMYKLELEKFGFRYAEIVGIGEERLANARKALQLL